ncbi:MAG TPA: hypothetical protein VGX49_10645 [Jatrophihabitans sp.]|jgi:hypothetical protein|nr:hypothetical protein [Jatrophihabitans sp.]
MAIAVATGIGSALVASLLIGGPHHSARHHDGSRTGLVVAVCVLVAMLAGLAVMARKLWRSQGMFAAPLIAGLEGKDRRAVSRAVRRGQPSSDPTLAAVERALAQRTVSQARRTTLVLGAGMAGEGILAVVREQADARIFFGASAVLFAALLALHLRTLHGARRYLAQAPATVGGNLPP